MRIFLTTLNLLLSFTLAKAQQSGDELPKWQPGYLDLHHISTGRGDAAFYVFPDGTSMIVDAGDMSETNSRITSPRNTRLVPNNSKNAGEWIADYIRQFHPKSENAELDYAMITHFHDDHMGETDSLSPKSKWGEYQVAGVTEVGEHIPIKLMVDRDYPDYDYPVDIKSEAYFSRVLEYSNRYDPTTAYSMKNYWKFLEAQKQRGFDVQQYKPGVTSQFALTHDIQAYHRFSVRNICGNGIAWTGWGEETFEMTPQEIKEGTDKPGENSLSLAIKISYGEFDYFTGGDIAGNNAYGESYLESIESQVAPVIGPVDVATLNHHGNRDSQNTYYVRTVRPKVWIQQCWSSDHPGDDVLRRIASKDLYPGDRYILTTEMLEANRLVIGERIDRVYQSTQGHILIRVYPRGREYQIFILNDQDEERKITKVFDRIKSR